MKDEIRKIEEKIEGVIAEWDMLPAGCTVVVGLSGGADSMALTHFLLNYATPRHIHLSAAHINHGIRGEEAARDEAFVTRWCAQNGVALRVLHADVPALAAGEGVGLEECGRRVRYSFFRELCGENGKIATAHTLSDSCETVLFNLAKGAGTRGMRGIPPVRGNIVRPLIAVTRAQVERYCANYGVPYVTDSTNFSGDYARNKIRLRAVPVLREINPAFEQAVCGMTRRLQEDDEYLSVLAQDQLSAAVYHGGYRANLLARLPDPLLSRALMLAARRVTGARLESRHVEDMMALVRRGYGGVTVAGGAQCRVQGETVYIFLPKKAVQWSVPLNPSGTLLPDGRTLLLNKLTKNAYENRRKFNNLFFINVINYATILNITSVRNRREGDAYRPAGRGVTKSLKKLFNEAGLEPMRRGDRVILESGGKILWVEGFGSSQEACVTDDTQNIAEIKIV